MSLLAPIQTAAQDSLTPLFTPVDAAAAQPLTAQNTLVGTERTRYVSTDSARLNTLAQNAAPQILTPLILNLFDDVVLTAIPDYIEPRMGGRDGVRDGVQWFGHIDGVTGSNVTFIITPDGRMTGRVMTPTESFYIAPIAGGSPVAGVHRVTQIDIVKAHEALEAGVPVPPQDETLDLAPVLADSGDLIDVMVVYTPAAEAILGGAENTILAIEEMVAMTNQSYMNSQINQRVRLVHVAPVIYTEDPTPYTSDLNAISSTTDGQMDEVHALRSQYAADLVMLLTGTPADVRNYCGIAWMLNGSPTRGFSVAEAVCVGTVVMPHELGHNMGAAHDKANGGTGYYSYAYGYQDVKESIDDWGDFVTVMAYGRNSQCPTDNPLADVGEAPICPHILQWSDPAQTFNGKPLGNANTNNVLTLNNTAQIVANFRVQIDPPDAPTNLNAALNGLAVDLTWMNTGAYDEIYIERSSDNGVSFAPLVTVGGTDTTYTDSALNCSTTYTYRVKGIVSGAESPYSSTAQVASPACETGTELLVNGGFESYETKRNPLGWSVTNLSGKDRIKCDRPEEDKFFAYSGECAFQFKGEANERSRLAQKTALDGINTGDTLTVSAYVRTKNASSGGKIRLTMAYEDGTRDKAILNLSKLLGATSDYTHLAASPVTVKQTLSLVRVQIRYQRLVATGKIFVDDVSLWRAVPAPLENLDNR